MNVIILYILEMQLQIHELNLPLIFLLHLIIVVVKHHDTISLSTVFQSSA